MSHRIAPMSPIDAAAKVCAEFAGGNAAMAQRLGVSVNSLRHMLNPCEGSTAKLGVEQLMRICEIAGDWAPLHAMNLQAGFIAFKIPADDEDGDALMQSVAAHVDAFSKNLNTVNGACADGKVTANELKRMQESFLTEVRSGIDLLSRAQAIHEAAKPASLRQVA